MPAVAVTGAHGFIGARLVRRFRAAGRRVVGLVRDPSRPGDRGVEYVSYDLTAEPPADALSEIAVLVHAAYARDDLTTNVEGSRRLVACAREQGVERSIFLSSMAARSDAVSVYGRQKLEVEAFFDSDRDAVLRPGLVIGNGGLVGDTVRFMRRWHAVPLPDGGRQPLQTIGMRDLIGIVERVVDSGITGTWTLADPRRTTYGEVYRAIARGAGLRVVFIPVPSWLPLFALRLGGRIGLPLRVGEDNIRGLMRARYIDTGTDLRRLGVELQPLEQTVQCLRR